LDCEIEKKRNKIMKKRKFETFVPVFSGFYGTVWEHDLQMEISTLKESLENFLSSKTKKVNIIDLNNQESDLIYDNFDYNAYREYIAKTFCDELISYIPFIQKIKFQKIQSPKEYNFVNDSIDCEITLKSLKAFQNYLYENKEKLDKYLHLEYTSCDGFISSYPNNFDEWESDTENFTNLKFHYLGSLLDFYVWNEYRSDCIDLETLIYENMYENIYMNEFINLENIAKTVMENEDESFEFTIKYIDVNQLELEFKD